MAGKNATLNEYHNKPATPQDAEIQQLAQAGGEPVKTDLTTVLNADRLALGEIAQTIFATEGWEQNAVLSGIKQQCEDRIAAIDEALQDV
jgi:hypothetical protein